MLSNANNLTFDDNKLTNVAKRLVLDMYHRHVKPHVYGGSEELVTKAAVAAVRAWL
jgi:hypothetical protein